MGDETLNIGDKIAQMNQGWDNVQDAINEVVGSSPAFANIVNVITGDLDKAAGWIVDHRGELEKLLETAKFLFIALKDLAMAILGPVWEIIKSLLGVQEQWEFIFSGRDAWADRAAQEARGAGLSGAEQRIRTQSTQTIDINVNINGEVPISAGPFLEAEIHRAIGRSANTVARIVNERIIEYATVSSVAYTG